MGAHDLAARCHRERLDADVIDRSHPEFDRGRAVWNGMIDRRPGVIVRARTINSVRRTIRIAAEHGAPLAVRGGGHNVAGQSTCDDGLLLDLGFLRHVEVDQPTRTVRVGGGALLADLDRAGQQFGLATPAGVVSHTGVGGLTLGGGMGWLSRRFGMSVDNLLGAELVTADGRVLQVSAEHEPDLFWAIRGGGGNFGVVTTFRFRLHPVDRVVVAAWRYRPSVASSVLEAIGHLAPANPRELTFSLNLTRDGLAVTACWSGAAHEAEAQVAPLDRLAPALDRSITSMPFVEFQRRHDDLLPWGRRYYSRGGYFRALDGSATASLMAAAQGIPSAASEIYLLQLGGAVADLDNSAAAFTGRHAEFFWLVQPIWDDAGDDQTNISWGRHAAELLAARSALGNYVNEQSELGGAGIESAYGVAKYARLAEIKARYDPSNVFRLNQNIRPQSIEARARPSAPCLSPPWSVR